MEEPKVGKKIQCKQCHKKVTVLEITRAGSKIICAPCKDCTSENILIFDEWERGPAEVDLLNQYEVVRYIRDLINLSGLLENGLDEELNSFMQMLRAAGYSDTVRQRLLNFATTNTRYDHMTDIFGRKLVPRVIPDGEKR